MGQPLGSVSPFGAQRVPPPATGGYGNPTVSYPTGANPAGMSGVGTPNLSAPAISVPAGTGSGTATGTVPGAPRTSGLFGTPSNQFPITGGNPVNNGVAPAAYNAPDPSSAPPGIRLNGMPVSDATGSGVPEITNLPPAQAPPGLVPNNAAGSVPAYVPPYTPGSTNGAGNLGWKSKAGGSGTDGTTLR